MTTAGEPARATMAFNVTTIVVPGIVGDAPFSAEDIFVVLNTGAGTYSGIAVSSNAAWCTVTLGQDESGNPTITPVIDPDGLSAGTRNATLTVTDANASNSGQTLTVTLTLTDAEITLGVFPSTMTFTVEDEEVGVAGTATLFATGGSLSGPTVGTITYSGAVTNWVSATNVTNSGDGTYTLSVTPTAVGGTVGGPYTATIPVDDASASNGPVNVTATLNITAATTALLALDRQIDDTRFTVGGATPSDVTVGMRLVGGSGVLAGPTSGAASYTGDFSGWATLTLTTTALTVSFDLSGVSTDGESTVSWSISDANATNAVTYTVHLRVGSGTPTPFLLVSPSAVSVPVATGTDAPNTTVTVGNATGALSGLGTVGASFVSQVSWASVSYASGVATIVFDTSPLAVGVYSATLRITATLASNSPVDVPLQVVVSDPSAATYPVPAMATPASGYAWDDSVGYPVGSVLNPLSITGAADGARPTFGGAVHTIPGDYASWAAAMADVTGGTIVPGDIIRIAAGTTITDAQFPVIPGWTAGDPFICVQSANMANLPAYSGTSGPASYGAANCVAPADAVDMPIFQTTTIDRSVLNFQQGSGGWWIEGVWCYANTSAATQSVVNLSARNGTAQAQQTQTSHVPQQIVIDRCYVSSANGHQYCFVANSRYTRITHSYLEPARRPGTASTNYENKPAYLTNTDGHVEFLGNYLSHVGIGLLWGGSQPAIPNAVPSDCALMWNYITTPLVAGDPDEDDCKNGFEWKTGKRCIVAFNVVTNHWWRVDQKYGIIVKSTDPSEKTGNVCNVPQTPYAAHCSDLTIWGNLFYNGTKAFISVVDTYSDCGAGAALGTDRVEVGYNLHISDSSHVPAKYNTGSNYLAAGQRFMVSTYKSQGDGMPSIHFRHNTCVLTDLSVASFLDLGSDSAGGAFWGDFIFSDNVLWTPNGIFFNPVYRGGGSPASNSAGLDVTIGAGRWVCRRNLIPTGTRTWDATLSGGSNQNGYLLSGTNFVDPATRNYALVPGHPSKGTATDGTDPGYDQAYLVAMTSTVVR